MLQTFPQPAPPPLPRSLYDYNLNEHKRQEFASTIEKKIASTYYDHVHDEEVQRRGQAKQLHGMLQKRSTCTTPAFTASAGWL